MTGISRAIRWQNGMVMVFDSDGQQIPEYQGKVEEVRGRILNDAPPDATFYRGEWRSSAPPQAISREEFAGEHILITREPAVEQTEQMLNQRSSPKEPA